MSSKTHSNYEKWAHFRFSVIGSLLSAPPNAGELKGRIVELAEKLWRHPINGTPLRVSRASVERWYYEASKTHDPVRSLRRKVRSDAGKQETIDLNLVEQIKHQYDLHPSWTYKLHADNLRVVNEKTPSYDSVRRFMKSRGFYPQARVRARDREGYKNAISVTNAKEKRSFESPFVGGLFHLDFHTGSKQILTEDGRWISPHIMAVIDDHSRLLCHAQWYLTETAEDLVHCVVQAFAKRGLPRKMMTDNGSAMTSAEFTEGLKRLGIEHETTMEYSPWQNGKQEVFWAQIEGRLIALIELKKNLTLSELNQYTQAWCEMEYNRHLHKETGQTPIDRYCNSKSVLRPSCSIEDLKFSFTKQEQRRLRRSDGSISLGGVRFEVPSEYHSLDNICVRYQRWDLSSVKMVDPKTSESIRSLYPVDKTSNADGRRRMKQVEAIVKQTDEGDIADLMKKYMSDYAAKGPGFAYIEKKSEVPHE